MGLEDLPPELLRRILENVLPYGPKLSFEQLPQQGTSDELRWTLYAAHSPEDPSAVVNKALHANIDHHPFPARTMEWNMELLSVSKNISSEARLTFFGGNLFALLVGAQPHAPVSLKSPLILGPLGLPERLHLLRDLKRIELTVHIDDKTPYAVVRHRERLRHFVDILHAHAEDDNKKARLQYLNVKVTIFAPHYFSERFRRLDVQYPDLNDYITMKQFERHMFTLESLTEITGIPTVIVDGVPNWWKQCLEMRMCGKGDDLTTLVWPDKLVAHKTSGAVSKVTTEAAWQAVFNWREFAKRYGIEMPEDAQEFFPPQKEPKFLISWRTSKGRGS